MRYLSLENFAHDMKRPEVLLGAENLYTTT
jgi:hypothetical protein